MMPHEFVLGPERARVLSMIRDVLTGALRFLLLIADNGAGKTFLLRKVLEKWSWEHALEHYVRMLREMKAWTKNGCEGREFDIDEIVEIASKLGIVTEQTIERAEELLQPRVTLARDYEEAICAPTVVIWMEYLAMRLGQPAPDRLRLLSLCGVFGHHETRYPILISGSKGDTPRSIRGKILAAIDPRLLAKRGMDRYMFLMDILRGLPLALLVDEADQLDTDCLNEIRQLAELSGTPFCLAGTRMLFERLATSHSLRALTTRVEAQATLGRLSAPDLQAAFPEVRNDIIVAVWTAARRNFRVAVLIMRMLQRMQAEFPGKRLTKRAVAFAASQVLAAQPELIGSADEEAAAPEEAISAAAPRKARAVAAAAPAPRAARAG